MSKPTAKAGFSKVWKLIAVLKKCNGKAVIGSSSALISPKAAKAMAAAGLVLLTGLLGAAAFIAEPYLMKYFPLQSYTQTLLVAVLLISFMLSVKNIVTVLYTADDISVLLPLPFSVGQIVTAKLTVTLQFPVILSLVLVNSTCLGFGIGAGFDQHVDHGGIGLLVGHGLHQHGLFVAGQRRVRIGFRSQKQFDDLLFLAFGVVHGLHQQRAAVFRRLALNTRRAWLC